MLSGKDTSHNIVADGIMLPAQYSYLLDSVLHGDPFGKNVMAANGSRAVVDYISNNKDAIGFVGSSWVTNDQDPEQKAYRIKFVLLY